MTPFLREVSRNAFTIGLFGGLAIAIPLMVLGFGSIGTAILMVGIFGGLLAESLVSGDETDEADADHTEESVNTDDELAALRERYVEGDLSEAEFERRVQAHLADQDAGGGATVERSRETETATRR